MAGIGGHILGAEVLRYILAAHIGLGLVAVVGIEQHTTLPDRVDAQGLGRLGKVDQPASGRAVDH